MNITYNHIIAFLAALATDWIWGAYIYNTAAKKVGPATLYSGFIILVGAYLVLTYTDDRTTVPFMVAGGMIGTYTYIKWELWRDAKKKLTVG